MIHSINQHIANKARTSRGRTTPWDNAIAVVIWAPTKARAVRPLLSVIAPTHGWRG